MHKEIRIVSAGEKQKIYIKQSRLDKLLQWFSLLFIKNGGNSYETYFVISFLIGLFATTSLAQISGGFYMIDGYVYFKGQNASGYGLGNITIQCVNSYLGQQLEFTMDFLPNGNSFTIGPSNGWEWQQGEQLFITFANGQSVYWTYQPVPAYDSPYDNYSDDSYSNNLVVREQIRQLESKIRDAERSLRQYEERNRQNPSISNTQLINSQRRLINTYEDRIQQLMRQIR